MSAKMVVERKTEEGAYGRFHRVPRCLYREKLTPTAILVYGKVLSSRSQNEQRSDEKCCRLTYAQAHAEFGITAPPMRDAIRTLKEHGKIKLTFRDRNGAAYSCLEEYAGKRYDVIPEYLFKDEFLIEGKMRKLTSSERRILAHIMTLASYRKNDGAVEGSSRIFARTLNLSEKTVRTAIHALLKGGLIFRRAEDKGVNGNKRSKYRPNLRLYDYQKSQKKRRKPVTSKLPAEVQAANARAERERYFAKLQEENSRRAEKYRRLANANPRFKEVSIQIAALGRRLAEEEIAGGNTYKKMEESLQQERSALLASMNIQSEWLTDTYFCTCKKCQDTGFLPNGKSCNCYKRE